MYHNAITQLFQHYSLKRLLHRNYIVLFVASYGPTCRLIGFSWLDSIFLYLEHCGGPVLRLLGTFQEDQTVGILASQKPHKNMSALLAFPSFDKILDFQITKLQSCINLVCNSS